MVLPNNFSLRIQYLASRIQNVRFTLTRINAKKTCKIMSEEIYIHAGWLIDGTGGPVLRNTVLHVRNGDIQEIIPAEEMPRTGPDIVDMSDSTVLPGLVDSHIHLFMSGTDDKKVREHQLTAGFDDIKSVIEDHVKNHLSCGVISIRDGGDWNGHAVRYKDECLNKEVLPISLKTAGRAWRQQRRYGRLIGRPLSEGLSLAEEISKDGSRIDHIKIVNSGLNSLTIFGKETMTQFDMDEMKAAVRAAKDLGLKVMVHANGKEPVKIAVAAGCDSIEHGFFMGRDNLKLMADRGTTWVPTAITMKGYARLLKQGSLKADMAMKNLDHQIGQMSKAKMLGGRIALGTDAGSLGIHHGPAVAEEMKLLMEAGYTLEETVKCATLNGASLLGVSDAGVLKKGKRATFIVVRGNPSGILDRLDGIEHIYIKGKRYRG